MNNIRGLVDSTFNTWTLKRDSSPANNPAPDMMVNQKSPKTPNSKPETPLTISEHLKNFGLVNLVTEKLRTCLKDATPCCIRWKWKRLE